MSGLAKDVYSIEMDETLYFDCSHLVGHFQ